MEKMSDPQQPYNRKTFKDNFFEKIKKPLVIAGLVASSLPGMAQDDTFGQEPWREYKYTKTELDSLLFNERDTVDSGQHRYSKEDYITKDGNFRYYHNPSVGSNMASDVPGGIDLRYALGSTKSPFENLEEIKEKTKIPQSLGEVDFFVNYINSHSNADSMIEDSITGSRYYNYKENEPDRDGVDYEGENHWNVQRFFIDPHFSHFKTTLEESGKNATYDIYKYFLYQQKKDQEKELGQKVADTDVDRNIAWQRAEEFMDESVYSIVNSKSAQWFNKNYLGIDPNRPKSYSDYYIHQPDWYNSEGATQMPGVVLAHNQMLLQGKKEGRLYGREELEGILIDYNINYREKTPDEARGIARESIDSELADVERQIDEIKHTPITEYKILRQGDYPEGFNNWDPQARIGWKKENPEKREIIQQEFTEKDRQREISLKEQFRFDDTFVSRYTEIDLDPVLFNERDDVNEVSHEDYRTKDGNIRYFKNPSRGKIKGAELAFSLGSTKNPFESLEEVKERTKVPQSLGEVDFFVNYINTHITGVKSKIQDSVTGNFYYDYKEKEPDRDEVDYKGDKHWNVQRFFIEPHYGYFGTGLEESERNATYDAYKYFLYQQKKDQEKELGQKVADTDVDRNIAWQRAEEFMDEYVHTITKSTAARWIFEKYDKVLPSPLHSKDLEEKFRIRFPALYLGGDATSLPASVLEHNSTVLLGEADWEMYSLKEIKDFLVGYNINYRRKSLDEAQKITAKNINDAIEGEKKRFENYMSQPDRTQEEKNRVLRIYESLRFVD